MNTASIAFDHGATFRKWLLVGILVAGVSGRGFFIPFPAKAPQPFPSEITRVLSLFQDYREQDFKIIFNGNTYEAQIAIEKARKFLFTHYHGEDIARWIRTYLYRSPDQGKIIYLAFPDGSKRALRDVLIEDLKRQPVSH